MTKLSICAHILFYSKHERFLPYLINRALTDIDSSYKSDEYLLHTLQKKDEELKWRAND